MANWRNVIVVTTGLSLLWNFGCSKQPEQKSEVLPVSVEGDIVTKTAVEDILRANPTVVLPGSKTEYSIRIVKPDPGIDYSIMQVKPDPNTQYTVLFIDPTTNQETILIKPEAKRAIAELLKMAKQQAENISQSK